MAEPTPLPPARSFPWFAYLLLALVGVGVGLAGVWLMYRQAQSPDLGTVSTIRLTAKPGIDLSKLEELLDTPDYYIELWTEQGKQRTKTFADTRVGNGLTFSLPVPLRLVDVKEIKVFDEDVIKDRLVDRVDHPGRQVDGEKFHFQLEGSIPPAKQEQWVPIALMAAGGGVLLIALVRFIWAQVV